MKLPPITAAELKSQLDAGAALRLVDVREHAEWISELGHIQGAELIPLGTLSSKLASFQGETREIISICKSGMRAGQAAELLARAGHKVRVLTGGTLAWKAAGLPTSREP
jgi:rhodanese-related sulfurtransferase